MRGLVGTLEVCSPGELEICRQMGVPADMVLFSGVNKTKADVERAMDLGVTHFTCESPLHIRLIDEAARARGRFIPFCSADAGSNRNGRSGFPSPRLTAAPIRRTSASRACIIFPAHSARNSTAQQQRARECWPN